MFLDPCCKCPHSEVHWDGVHACWRSSSRTGCWQLPWALYLCSIQDRVTGNSSQAVWTAPPFAFDGGLWVWCGKHIQNDKTKMFSFLDLVITNRNKTTTAAKDLWEVRPVQVLKADFLRLDKPSKGLFLEKTLFLTLQPLSACGSSSRVDF